MINNKNNLREKDKKGKIIIAILLLIAIIGVGYAALGANLKINGVANIPSASWDVHFKTGSINVTNGSVTIDTNNNEQAATITNATQVNYAVKLALPGDFYEFTVVAENTGSIDAMIDSISSKLGDTEITTGTLPSYLDYSVTYSDGIAIVPHHLLTSNSEETYKVRLEYKTDIDSTDLPDEATTLNLNFQLNYVQADDTAITRPVPSFEDDSWETIINNVQNGNTSIYTVGSTKTIDMGTFGTHTLRVANNSTPAECSTQGFSQSACGFVLEFADIITIHQMNPYTDGLTNGDGNKGGWEYSEMRTYINVDIYNSLPSTLKNAIINTTVLSGHGPNISSNFTTIDKLYLLSTHEVWEDVDTGSSGINDYDTAYNNTRQLDYYNGLNITTSSYSRVIKKYNNSDTYWWLRSARLYNYESFFDVSDNGAAHNFNSNVSYGVSPAFRLAE